MTTPRITDGFHHITLVASDARQTLAFWRDLLGLGLVKQTVNFDDPRSYHLYFGDEAGRPGTLVTFFEWGHAPHGHFGIGGIHHLALGVATPEAQLKWKRRLQDAGVPVSGPFDRGLVGIVPVALLRYLLVPVDAQSLQVRQLRDDKMLLAALAVEVIHAHEEPRALRAREQPGEQRCAEVAQMQIPAGRWCVPTSAVHAHMVYPLSTPCGSRCSACWPPRSLWRCWINRGRTSSRELR